MGQREYFYSLQVLARAMSGEKNVLENMEKEGQSFAVNSSRMARKMRPSREAWEKLGFVFSDIEGDDVLCNAVLPEGWSIKATDHSMWNNIYDEKGNERGSMFYKAAFYDRDAHMNLERRYHICTVDKDGDSNIVEVYFGNSKEKLFVAGELEHNPDAPSAERRKFYDEEEKLRELAIEYANENYPEWEDPTAYWDIEDTKGPLKK